VGRLSLRCPVQIMRDRKAATTYFAPEGFKQPKLKQGSIIQRVYETLRDSGKGLTSADIRDCTGASLASVRSALSGLMREGRACLMVISPNEETTIDFTATWIRYHLLWGDTLRAQHVLDWMEQQHDEGFRVRAVGRLRDLLDEEPIEPSPLASDEAQAQIHADATSFLIRLFSESGLWDREGATVIDLASVRKAKALRALKDGTTQEKLKAVLTITEQYRRRE